jgi:hypothetical protein
MNSETKNCQNCKKNFIIESEDFNFYEKIKVPPPTFCPECRYKRRIIWRNIRHLFRGVDALTKEEIFTGVPPQSGIPIFELSYWESDNWDPMVYGKEYDFSKNFFEQFYKLFYEVPYCAKSVQRSINSEYSNMCDDMKNTYLCFNATFLEDCAYCTGVSKLKNCFDMSTCYENELCYENVRVDKSYHVVGSVMLESCVDVFFSKDCVGCNHCFGCVNQRNSSYMIFNYQYSKEDYFEKLKSFRLDTWEGFNSARDKAHDFWKKFPVKHMLGFRNQNVSGEDIKDSRNAKHCYIVKKGENLKYVQDVAFGNTTNSYDHTSWGLNASQLYESLVCGENLDQIKFSFLCYSNCQELEYCIGTRRSKNCFGCVEIKDKQYCIFNKQYTKDEYFSLVEKIKKHMNDMPFIDKRGNVYKYGEFFPVEFSPFAYNETLLNDQFPSSKNEVEQQGFIWRDADKKEYETTINGVDLPESINDTEETIIKEIIKCSICNRAYRIHPSEYSFLKNMNLPLPRHCISCRFLKRQKFIAPPKFIETECMCNGEYSTNSKYKNTKKHDSHESEKCHNSFETAYDLEDDIIYCEKCYQQEIY